MNRSIVPPTFAQPGEPRHPGRRLPLGRLPAVVLAVVCLWLAGCDPVDADFFPLAEGNTWLYDWSKRGTAAVDEPLPAPSESRMWTVVDPPGALGQREAATHWTPQGTTALALKNHPTESVITYAGEYRPGGTVKVSKLNGMLTVQTQSYQAEVQPLQLNLPLLVWPVHAGAKWEDHGPENLTAAPVAQCRLIGFETVETPAGRFFECAHVVRSIDPSMEGIEARVYRVQHFWLAPEIGLVKILYENDFGPVLRAELRAFHLTELTPAERQAQVAEFDATMDPSRMRQPGDGGTPPLTPEEMHRRVQYTIHDDFRR